MQQFPRVAMSTVFLILGASGSVFAQEADQMPLNGLSGATPKYHASKLPGAKKGYQPLFGKGVTGIDSIVNFTSSFTSPGFDPNGVPQSVWQYSMVGNDPAHSRTTTIQSDIVPVSVLLLNYDGTPRYVNGQLLYADATQFVQPLIKSPLYQNYPYSSSDDPTQFVDAIQKAEFGRTANEDWHTLLAPVVKSARLMTLLRGTYRYALNADGSCCAYILVNGDDFGAALFPPTVPIDGTTVIGAAELAGDMTTKQIATFLFNNVFLYDNNDPTECCVIGYHSFDQEPGATATANQQWFVMNYASWVTPGLFGSSFEDITALSHEMAELVNDPFVGVNGYNITPWWLAPNGLCQDNLETGDVIEGLPNAVFPIKMNGYTYHPQNEALLPWFEFQTPSKGLPRVYSYPDTTVLTSPATPQKAACAN